MASQETQRTTDHDTIREWAEARGGVPTYVAETESGGSGVLRIHFPEGSSDDEAFDEMGWGEFFDQFEENDLAFLYQEGTEGGDESRFFKFVSRD